MAFSFEHSSPSDCDLVLDEPFLWMLKHAEVFGQPNWFYKTVGGPATDRGSAAENAVVEKLRNNKSLDEAINICQKDFRERLAYLSAAKMNDEERREYDDIPNYVTNIYALLDSQEFAALGLGELVDAQHKHVGSIQTTRGPQEWWGFTDFKHKVAKCDDTFAYWDLKTTRSSQLSFRKSHQLQLAYYADATGCQQHICYVKPVSGTTKSGKKSVAVPFKVFSLTADQRSSGASRRKAGAEYMMSLYRMGWEDAMRVSMPRDIYGFRWDDGARKIAKEIWGIT